MSPALATERKELEHDKGFTWSRSFDCNQHCSLGWIDLAWRNHRERSVLMKYTVKVLFPHYLDVEVEEENIEKAREAAIKAASYTTIDEWRGDLLEVYETEWIDEDGIHTII